MFWNIEISEIFSLEVIFANNGIFKIINNGKQNFKIYMNKMTGDCGIKSRILSSGHVKKFNL